MNKDCSTCVYNGVCEDRKDDSTILDCCIPEKPLRKAQNDAFKLGGIELFINVTYTHIRKLKVLSKYWLDQITKYEIQK